MWLQDFLLGMANYGRFLTCQLWIEEGGLLVSVKARFFRSANCAFFLLLRIHEANCLLLSQMILVNREQMSCDDSGLSWVSTKFLKQTQCYELLSQKRRFTNPLFAQLPHHPLRKHSEASYPPTEEITNCNSDHDPEPKPLTTSTKWWNTWALRQTHHSGSAFFLQIGLGRAWFET